MKTIACILQAEDTPAQSVVTQSVLYNRYHLKDVDHVYVPKKGAEPIPHLEKVKAGTVKGLLDQLAKKSEIIVVRRGDSLPTLSFWEHLKQISTHSGFFGVGYSPTDIVPLRAVHHPPEIIRLAYHEFTTIALKASWWKENQQEFQDFPLDHSGWFLLYTAIFTRLGSFLGNKHPNYIFRNARPYEPIQTCDFEARYDTLIAKWNYWLKAVLMAKGPHPLKYERFYELAFFNDSHEKLSIEPAPLTRLLTTI